LYFIIAKERYEIAHVVKSRVLRYIIYICMHQNSMMHATFMSSSFQRIIEGERVQAQGALDGAADSSMRISPKVLPLKGSSVEWNPSHTTAYKVPSRKWELG
jgi:hypothetical protein